MRRCAFAAGSLIQLGPAGVHGFSLLFRQFIGGRRRRKQSLLLLFFLAFLFFLRAYGYHPCLKQTFQRGTAFRERVEQSASGDAPFFPQVFQYFPLTQSIGANLPRGFAFQTAQFAGGRILAQGENFSPAGGKGPAQFPQAFPFQTGSSRN